MKAKVMSMILVLFAVYAVAQEIPIRQAYRLEWNGACHSTVDNHDLVLWEDTIAGTRNIYAQKYGSSGQQLWASHLRLSDGTMDAQALASVQTSDQHYIVLWEEWDYPTRYLYLRKFSATGEVLWQNPMQIYAGSEYLLTVKMLANSTGGAFVVLVPDYWATTVIGYNVDGNAQHLWSSSGQELVDYGSRVNLDDLVSDCSDGFIMNCSVEYESFQSESRLLRVSSQGSIVGANPLIAPLAFPAQRYSISTCTDGNFLLYTNPVGYSILTMQKMNSNGVLPNDPVSYILDQFAYSREFVLLPKPGGGFYTGWRGIDPDSSRVLAQSYSNSLVPEWQSGGVEVFGPAPDVSGLSIAVDPTGGLWLNYLGQAAHLDANGIPSTPVLGVQYSTNWDSVVALAPKANCVSIYWKDMANHKASLRRQFIGRQGTLLLGESGVPVVEMLWGNTTNSSIIALSNRYISIWSDTRNGWQDHRIYYQILSSDGSMLLEENGRALNPGTAWQENIQQVEKFSDDSVAILYCRFLEYQCEWLVQVVNRDGQPLYPGPGVLLGNMSSYPLLQMGCHAGSIYFGYINVTTDNRYELIGLRVADGMLQWSQGGKLLLAFPENCYANLTQIVGSHYIYYMENWNNGTNDCRAMRVNSSGGPYPGWPLEGTSLIVHNPQDYYSLWCTQASVHNDELTAVVEVQQNPHDFLLAQKLSASGQRLWGNTGVTLGQDMISEGTHKIVINEDIHLLYQPRFSNESIYYQKLSSTGQLLCGQDGLQVTDAIMLSGDYNLIGFQDGSLACVWTSESSQQQSYGPYTDLAYRYIGSDATLAGEVRTLCAARNGQRYISSASIGSQALITWQDDRAGEHSEDYSYSSIYGRMINSFSTPNVDPAVPEISEAILQQNYPNPFNPSTTIRFSLRDACKVDLDIYNVRGQLVKSVFHQEPMLSGHFEVVWDGKDTKGTNVSGGVYVYRLRAGGTSLSRKMVLAK